MFTVFDQSEHRLLAVEEKSSPEKYLEKKAAACESQRLLGGHKGSLLSCIGNNLLELQDFQVDDESVCDASFRWQLCEEEDVRFLELWCLLCNMVTLARIGTGADVSDDKFVLHT